MNTCLNILAILVVVVVAILGSAAAIVSFNKLENPNE